MTDYRILVINPGSTSTKLAYFAGEAEVFREVLEHPAAELAAFPDIASQAGFRTSAVIGFIRGHGLDARGFDGFAARGGMMKPVRSGVYRINAAMLADLARSRERWGREHASNLGPMIADRLAGEYRVPAFTADPVTVDEMAGVARLSGVPEISRKSMLHALNVKAVFRRIAADSGLTPGEARCVVAHLGGGITVAAVDGGRIIDVNNALLGMGPFSTTRAGALPIGDLAALAFSGRYDLAGLGHKLVHESGLIGYTGTADLRVVEARIAAGDADATVAHDAMAYQISKEIAAMAAVLEGRVDAVGLTGGMANSGLLVGKIKDRAGFIADVMVYPGEFEMEALAMHARSALSGGEVFEYA